MVTLGVKPCLYQASTLVQIRLRLIFYYLGCREFEALYQLYIQ